MEQLGYSVNEYGLEQPASARVITPECKGLPKGEAMRRRVGRRSDFCLLLLRTTTFCYTIGSCVDLIKVDTLQNGTCTKMHSLQPFFKY